MRENGFRGLLLVKTVLRKIDTAGGAPFLPDGSRVSPKMDTIMQAMACLLCDKTSTFVEIALVHSNWIWSWRLQRDEQGLATFLEELAPLVADWAQIVSAVDETYARDPVTNLQARAFLERPTLLAESREKIRVVRLDWNPRACTCALDCVACAGGAQLLGEEHARAQVGCSWRWHRVGPSRQQSAVHRRLRKPHSRGQRRGPVLGARAKGGLRRDTRPRQQTAIPWTAGAVRQPW